MDTPIDQREAALANILELFERSYHLIIFTLSAGRPPRRVVREGWCCHDGQLFSSLFLDEL